jgi:hypothetical protein
MNISPFLSINRPADEVLYWSKEQLQQVDLRSVQTFDLHATRVGLHNCPCPHHGTDACDCQMVVLLIYGKETEPVTLILHGSNGQTWLSIASDLQPKMSLITAIQQALEVEEV